MDEVLQITLEHLPMLGEDAFLVTEGVLVGYQPNGMPVIVDFTARVVHTSTQEA